MRFFLSSIFFFIFISIEAGEISRQQYLALIERYPNLIQPQGDFSKGEIQIVTDPQEMEAIEKAIGRDVGIIALDKYWLWINDACIFPTGHKGVYGRILWAHSLKSSVGVAVMPVMPNGKIVLICNFRHATRSWEIELPRGGITPGEEIEAAAKRETMEETGMRVDSLVYLGEMPPDTGLTSTVIPLFMAKVVDKHALQQEETEAIEGVLFLTIQEIKQAFLQGYYEYNIRGVQTQISCRDPFLAYALFMYELKQ